MEENKNLKETYNGMAEDWYQEHKDDTWWHKNVDKFASFLEKGDEVLDIGCGAGTKSKYLIDKGLKVTGIDYSDKFIEIAQKEILEGEFLVMDLEDIDKLEKNFDAISMQAVLLHFPKKEAENVLRKVVQKLKDGGYLYLTVKQKKEGEPEEETRKEKAYGKEWERFFSYYSMEEIEEYFKNLGIQVIYKDIGAPSRTIRNTNWLHIIGKK